MFCARWFRTSRLAVQSFLFFDGIFLLASIDWAKEQASSHGDRIEVRSYVDTQSAGWAYKKSDFAFVAESKGCRIQWNAVEMKGAGSKKQLSVRRDCPVSFSEQIPVHRAILKEIFSRWPVSEFDSISWGSFGGPSDWSWNLPIAVASFHSKDYRDYRANYPNVSMNINLIFVKLANQTNAYRALQQIIREFGADIELSAVEKVFVSEATPLPFYPALKDHGISGKSRVIYDVAFSYFKIKK